SRPVQARAPPALAVRATGPGDDRRFDDELLPPPRGSERSGDDGFPVRINRRLLATLRGVLDAVGGRRVHLVERGYDGRAGIRAGSTRIRDGSQRTRPTLRRLAQLRHLTQRQVLVEALRGQAFDRARQQSHKRPAGGIGTACAAIEVRGNTGSVAGVLEETEILGRRSQKYRHLVEWNAACRLIEYAPDDFDRLTTFSGRREQPNVTGTLPRRRSIDRED